MLQALWRKYYCVWTLILGAVLGLLLYQALSQSAVQLLLAYQRDFCASVRERDLTAYDYMLTSCWERMRCFFVLVCIRFTPYFRMLYSIPAFFLGLGMGLLLRFEVTNYLAEGVAFFLGLLLPQGIFYGLSLWKFCVGGREQWERQFGWILFKAGGLFFLGWLAECSINPWIIKKLILYLNM